MENTGTCEEVRELWRCREKLSTVDGVLLCDGALVIPHELRQAVLDMLGSACQDDQAIGDRVANAVFWPSISEDVANHRQSVQRGAPSQPYRRDSETDLPSMPFESVAMDYFGYAGTQYLVVVDKLSDWVEVMRTPPASVYPGSKDLLMLLRGWFARFGVPVRLSSDGGPEFATKEIKDFLARWGIQHECSSAQCPSSNGRTEVNVKATKRLV